MAMVSQSSWGRDISKCYRSGNDKTKGFELCCILNVMCLNELVITRTRMNGGGDSLQSSIYMIVTGVQAEQNIIYMMVGKTYHKMLSHNA